MKRSNHSASPGKMLIEGLGPFDCALDKNFSQTVGLQISELVRHSAATDDIPQAGAQ
jgi:hypothetical protein